MEQKTIGITLVPIKLGVVTVKVIGKSPLLMDRMSTETKMGILAKQTGIAKGNKKKTRDTKQEVIDAIHVTSDGKVGFPSFGFKKGMMEATSFIGDKAFSKKLLSGVQIVNSVEGLVPISFDKQTVLEHTINGQTKFTPCFNDWTCSLKIKFDENNVSAADIVACLNYAGFYNGIGAWRPKGAKGGSGEFGMYEVQVNGK